MSFPGERGPKLFRVREFSRLKPIDKQTEEVSGQESKEHDICISQLGSKSSLKVICHVESVPVLAVVDTAADVTIISENVYRQLNISPACSKTVSMKCAGMDQSFTARQVGPVKLGIVRYMSHLLGTECC